MAFKYFELAMVIVSVLGRIAGTVAIVWLIVTRLADGFFTPPLSSWSRTSASASR